MQYAGAIRIDHILGLKRFYLVPRGLRADQGAYVRFPFEALLAAAAQESIAKQCIVIGEDLGTVPPGFQDTLATNNVLIWDRVRGANRLDIRLNGKVRCRSPSKVWRRV